MSDEKNFDPRNVKQYFGTMVKTRTGSLYGLTSKGKFTGRPSIEGSDLKLIAGIEGKYYSNIVSCLPPSRPELKQKLDDLILRYGKEIKPGLHLVVSLTSDYVKQKNRHGFISPRIVEVE